MSVYVTLEQLLAENLARTGSDAELRTLLDNTSRWHLSPEGHARCRADLEAALERVGRVVPPMRELTLDERDHIRAMLAAHLAAPLDRAEVERQFGIGSEMATVADQLQRPRPPAYRDGVPDGRDPLPGWWIAIALIAALFVALLAWAVGR